MSIRCYCHIYKKGSYALIGLVLACILQLVSGTAPLETGLAFGVQNLTEEQLNNLQPTDLELYNGLPVLPFYSIEHSTALKSLNGPTYRSSSAKSLVALQVGHWRSQELPAELSSLRNSQGASAAGISEIEVGQDIARRIAFVLQAQNIDVKIFPARIPEGLSADVFLSLHSDWSNTAAQRGFKLARSRYSRIPDIDDRLLELLYKHYAQITQLPTEGNLTINMTGYYVFNHVNFHTSLSTNTPAAIIEMGFLTNPQDRLVLSTQADLIAQGISKGLLAFLNERESTGYKPLQPTLHLPVLDAITSNNTLVPVYDKAGQAIIAYVHSGQQFAYYELVGTSYLTWLPVINEFGQIKATQGRIIEN